MMDQSPIDTDTELPFLLRFSKEIEHICMIKSILRKHRYHQILQRRTTLSFRESLICRRWFTNTLLTCVFTEDMKTKII